jgi:hypothetical protein
VARSGRDLPPNVLKSMSTSSASMASGDGAGEARSRAWMASSVGSRKRHPRSARDCRSLLSAEEADAVGASAAAAIAVGVFSGGEVREAGFCVTALRKFGYCQRALKAGFYESVIATRKRKCCLLIVFTKAKFEKDQISL